MKSTSFIGLFVSTLVVSTSAVPHFNSIFGRGDGDTCTTRYGSGSCKSPKDCKGILQGKRYCGGSSTGSYQSQCCVETVCKAATGSGYCRSVEGGGCPGGTFYSNDYGSSEWPCTGSGVKCCVQDKTPYPPSDSDNSNSNSTSTTTTTSSTHPGGNGVINDQGVEMIKEQEGFRGDIYKDQVGVDTIGYGHNCATAPGTCEAMKRPISKKEGEDLMMKDLEQFEKCVCDLPNSEGLNSNQFSALVSFAFNTGCFGISDYYKDSMSKKDYKGICNSLTTTNTLNGVLENRRAAESKLCGTPTNQSCGCKGSR